MNNEVLSKPDTGDWQLLIDPDEFDLLDVFMGRIPKQIAGKVVIGWSYIMPIIDGIESLGYEVDIYKNVIEITTPDMIRFECSSKILAVYTGALEFIKWYNSQK